MLPVILLVGCGGSATTGQVGQPIIVGGDGDVIVAGTVIREMTATTFNGDITPAPGAHTVISLRRYVGEDAAAPLLVQVDAPFESLPLSYEVHGDAQKAFADHGTVLVSVEIYNHAGTAAKVGDLVSEYRYDLTATTRDYTLKVSGLEACESPSAGGFCVSTK